MPCAPWLIRQKFYRKNSQKSHLLEVAAFDTPPVEGAATNQTSVRLPWFAPKPYKNTANPKNSPCDFSSANFFFILHLRSRMNPPMKNLPSSWVPRVSQKPMTSKSFMLKISYIYIYIANLNNLVPQKLVVPKRYIALLHPYTCFHILCKIDIDWSCSQCLLS